MVKTLFEKIWDSHVVGETRGWSILYIDRHLGHDGSSRALSMLRDRGLPLHRPNKTLIVFDHAIPTQNQAQALNDPKMSEMLETVREFARRYDMKNVFGIGDIRNGISHVVGPEQGFSLPGTTLVCGDSHTATHGAFGALAFGIGASEVEHVFGTQTLLQHKPKTMHIDIQGVLPKCVYAKDIILALIGKIGTGGGTGCVIEYAGNAVRDLSMEGRMTVCNMTIEAGARAGLIAPDETTYDYLHGRSLALRAEDWDKALAYWETLASDPGVPFDRYATLDVSRLAPQVTWGTNPGMVVDVNSQVPKLAEAQDAEQVKLWEWAHAYMGISPGEFIEDLTLDRVFLGSCTNSRIEDLREAASFINGKKVADTVQAMVVPGSGLVKPQAEKEGLDRLFMDAGFEWRESGCSMCVGMNGDLVEPGQRCASTSNRNFEGRQGRGGRTHLVSPAMAVGAALYGHFVDVRELARGTL